ncbi:hypothetical protein BDY19DRAFT_910896 [Irpex rosettiformis]|uniref:Uncharacterized protein n=1 Tax=Irpex rosettiformis TaxID=378272 RepID=A0ACB8TM02_9APHY|nr:hypothetical protein BDY19DRAFT_910896 [Irpex rosettiformis]
MSIVDGTSDVMEPELMEIDEDLADVRLVPQQEDQSNIVMFQCGADAEITTADVAITTVQHCIWAGRTRAVRVEDVEDEEDEQQHRDTTDEEDEVMDDNDKMYKVISAWNHIHEHVQRQRGRKSAPMLTEDDLKHLRPFALKVSSHMAGRTFAKLERAFPSSDVLS